MIAQPRWMRACACVLALATVACARSRDRARAEQSTVTVLYGGDERLLGPYWRYTPQFLVYLPLVTRNAEGELEGRLAESWEHSADYRSWTIHLRKGVRWHDGVPVTAHDIKFTLDLLSQPDVLSFPPGGYSVSVLDDYTYTIRFHKHTGYKPLDDYQVYYPKHLLAHLDPRKFYDWDHWTHPVGNGPYRYVRHVPGTMIELRANPDYFRGRPKIARVVIKLRPSGDPSLTELVSGNVDALVAVNRADLLKLADPRFRVYDGQFVRRVRTIAWNERQPLFRDAKVRRALTLAINRRELLQVLNLSGSTPIFDVIFPPEAFGRVPLPDPLPYDLERARRLLDEAGWRDTYGDGVRRRDGKPFRFTAQVEPRWGMEKAAVYVQAQLRQAGVRMDLQTLEREAVAERVRTGRFEAAVFVMFSDVFGHASLFGELSPIGYSKPRVGALLSAAQATWDPDEVERIYRELWPIFQDDLPATFLSPVVWTGVAHRRLHGLSSPWRTDPVRCMEDLWLEDRDDR